MGTEKIYYQQPYLSVLTSEVTETETTAEGVWLLTQKTIFYPGGGGQLPDRGWIGQHPVLKIRADGENIWHLVPEWEGRPGAIDMRLNWSWREYQMQQHTGQHLLSHVLEAFKMHTVSVHLGEEYTMIEVDGALPDDAVLAKVETKANLLIRQHIPVHQHWVDRDQVHRFPLRRPPGDLKRIRVIEIEDLDFSACGGTHVSNTAEIGLVKALGWEKIRGHARMKFVIGQRAYEYFDKLAHTAQALQESMQSNFFEIPERIEALKAENQQNKKQIQRLLQELVIGESKNLIKQATEYGVIVVMLGEDETSRAELLAKELNKNGKYFNFIISGERFYFTYPQERQNTAQEFLRKAAQELGLRGGGPPGFVQGVVRNPDVQKIRNDLKDFVGK